MPPGQLNRDGRRVVLLLGCFDPFYAAHARTLAQLRAEEPDALIVAALDDLPEPLVPRERRAEVVAALASVEAVVLGAEEALAILRPDRVVDERASDARRTSELCQHVWTRHGAQ